MPEIERVAVVGAGLMGHGIAQVFASRGHPVAVFDPAPEALASVHRRIRSNLAFLGEPLSCLDRVALHGELEAAVEDADVVFEAAPEKVELKQELFVRIAAVAGPECILASNTSVIPIGQVGAKLADASRLLGTHWWNPPFLIPLVEIVPTERTAPALFQRCRKLLAQVGKVPVLVKRDVPGFVGNRLQHAMWREAIALVEAGVCDAETVDLVVKNSFGLRLAVLGPLENADLVGIDLIRDIHEVILPHLDRSAEPNPRLSRMLQACELGMKSGKGFYSWQAERAAAVRESLLRHLRWGTSRGD